MEEKSFHRSILSPLAESLNFSRRWKKRFHNHPAGKLFLTARREEYLAINLAPNVVRPPRVGVGVRIVVALSLASHKRFPNSINTNQSTSSRVAFLPSNNSVPQFHLTPAVRLVHLVSSLGSVPTLLRHLQKPSQVLRPPSLT